MEQQQQQQHGLAPSWPHPQNQDVMRIRSNSGLHARGTAALPPRAPPCLGLLGHVWARLCFSAIAIACEGDSSNSPSRTPFKYMEAEEHGRLYQAAMAR